jgi:hypothetical protein
MHFRKDIYAKTPFVYLVSGTRKRFDYHKVKFEANIL